MPRGHSNINTPRWGQGVSSSAPATCVDHPKIQPGQETPHRTTSHVRIVPVVPCHKIGLVRFCIGVGENCLPSLDTAFSTGWFFSPSKSRLDAHALAY